MIKRFVAMALAAVLLLSLSGCRNRGNEEQNSEPDIMEEDQLVLYHNNTEIAPMLMALAEEYSSATGKNFSAKLAGNDFFGEMKNSGAALYVVDTHTDLSEWHSGGLFGDLLNSTGLSSVFSGIPSGLQLNENGIGSYGIPLMLEGYGYIVDKTMLGDLFGSENADSVLESLRTCSFTEFEGFVAAVDTYIASPSAAAVTIGGKQYTFAPEKNGKAASLTGIFSLNSESTRAMEHLLSTALASKFSSRYEVITANENGTSNMENAVNAFIEVLDFHTSHIAGAEGGLSRGDEFTGGDYNYSTSIDLFTRGHALFYPGGTSDAADFEKSSTGFSKNLDIIPMKLPLDESDITASDMTAEKLQSSIVIGSRYYLAVNPKASEGLSASAMDFINWLYDDEAGKTAYSNAFGGVPFSFEYHADESGNVGNDDNASDENGNNTSTENPVNNQSENASNENSGNAPAPENKSSSGEKPATENPGQSLPSSPMQSHGITDSLNASVARYYAEGNWIPDMSAALPGDFIEKVLGDSLSDYWGMETWTDDDRKNFADIIIGGWKERLNKEQHAVG